jgi:paraquat-inducible protein B
MSKRLSPAAVGAFVVGAVTLAVIAIFVFGSGRLFSKTYPFVMYFTSDVSGLNIGAPVKFKGVEIGSVTGVKISVSQAALQERTVAVRIPVLIEIDAEQLAEKGATRVPQGEALQQMIDHGLRAQLATQSFVTGLLYVKLDTYPDTPVNLVNDPTVPYPELPTIPTPLEEVQARAAQFLAKLDQLDLPGIVASLHRTVDGLDRLFNSPHLNATLEELPGAVGELKNASASANTALISLRKLSDDLDARLLPLGGDARQTMADARETLRSATASLEQVQLILKPDAPIVYSLNRSLSDLAEAAHAIRRVAEELEQDPSVLLRGKGAAEEGR